MFVLFLMMFLALANCGGKSIYGFKQRVDNSLNKVVNTVANTSLLSSKLRKHWRTVLYILPVA